MIIIFIFDVVYLLCWIKVNKTFQLSWKLNYFNWNQLWSQGLQSKVQLLKIFLGIQLGKQPFSGQLDSNFHKGSDDVRGYSNGWNHPHGGGDICFLGLYFMKVKKHFYFCDSRIHSFQTKKQLNHLFRLLGKYIYYSDVISTFWVW
jgi:hypothetical protein